MDDRKQLTLYVGEEQLERWDKYQDELHFSSRAEMIRRAVEFFYSVQSEDEDNLMYDEILKEMDDLKDQVEIAISQIGRVREEQISQDNVQSFAQETSYFISQDLDLINTDDRKIIQQLVDEGIEYLRIDLGAIGFPDQVDEEFSDRSQVVRIEDAAENKILRPLIANIAQSEEDLEEQFGIEILSQEEAVGMGV